MATKYNFEFNLSERSINELTRNLQNYHRDLKLAKNYILEALADFTMEEVKKNIADTTSPGTSTGTLLSSIKKSPILNDTIRIYTDLAYAKFVEYGTGIVGAGATHPKASEAGWVYDKNEHGERGWVYMGSDGEFHWTAGQEGHQFMYRALETLKSKYMEIARKVLRERGLIKWI